MRTVRRPLGARASLLEAPGRTCELRVLEAPARTGRRRRGVRVSCGLGTDARRAVLLAVDRVHRAHLCGGAEGRGVRGWGRGEEEYAEAGRRAGVVVVLKRVKPSRTSSNLRSNILVTPFLHTSCTRR